MNGVICIVLLKVLARIYSAVISYKFDSLVNLVRNIKLNIHCKHGFYEYLTINTE